MRWGNLRKNKYREKKAADQRKKHARVCTKIYLLIAVVINTIYLPLVGNTFKFALVGVYVFTVSYELIKLNIYITNSFKTLQFNPRFLSRCKIVGALMPQIRSIPIKTRIIPINTPSEIPTPFIVTVHRVVIV